MRSSFLDVCCRSVFSGFRVFSASGFGPSCMHSVNWKVPDPHNLVPFRPVGWDLLLVLQILSRWMNTKVQPFK